MRPLLAKAGLSFRQPFEELKGGFPAHRLAALQNRRAGLLPDLRDRMMEEIIGDPGRDFPAKHKNSKSVQRIDERESGRPSIAELRLYLLPAEPLGHVLQRAQPRDQIAGLQHLDELQRNLGLARARRDAYLPSAENDAADDGGRRRDVERRCE